MNIQGFQKTTLLDYPEHLAATIFIGGCNFRCPFCHNKDLVLSTNESSYFSTDEILSFLEKRQSVLQGVCITGGEPTLAHHLPDFLSNIKSLGYLIKLDTNGSHPEVLKDLYKQNLIDYVAMDVKSGLSDYLTVCGLYSTQTDMLDNIKKSIHFLIRETDASIFDYEFRTTCVSPLHTEKSFCEIASLIEGASHYYLQSFVDNGTILANANFSSFSKDKLLSFADIVAPHVKHVEIRGE